jgi:YhcH/YjgK/YiaL family protein
MGICIQEIKMIIDRLKNAKIYHGLGENLKKALDFLAANDFSAMESGRHDIDGDRVFALIQRYETKPREHGLWEAHRRYIDVQYVVSGIEMLGSTHIDGLTQTQPYSEEKDCSLFAGSGDFATARAGDFLIFFPEDAHMPCLAHDQPAPVLKVVVKALANFDGAEGYCRSII